jgi:hypothetical protein
MNKFPALAAACAALLCCALPASAALELEGVYWYMGVSGEGSAGFDGVAGTTVDVEDDLGYDGGQDALGARLVVGSRHQLEVSYVGFDISADNSIDQTIRFSDISYRARTDVSSSLETTLIRGAYRFRAGSDTFGGGFLLGGEYVDFSASLAASGIGSASVSTQAGLPVIGVFAEFSPVGIVRLYGSLVAGTMDWDDINATFYEAEGSVRLVLGPVFAGAGYRYLSLDGEDSSIPLEVDLVFDGPTAYAGIEF